MDRAASLAALAVAGSPEDADTEIVDVFISPAIIEGARSIPFFTDENNRTWLLHVAGEDSTFSSVVEDILREELYSREYERLYADAFSRPPNFEPLQLVIFPPQSPEGRFPAATPPSTSKSGQDATSTSTTTGKESTAGEASTTTGKESAAGKTTSTGTATSTPGTATTTTGKGPTSTTSQPAPGKATTTTTTGPGSTSTTSPPAPGNTSAGTDSTTTTSGPAASGSSATSSTTAPTAFRVTGAVLRADPAEYSGPCPTTVKFSGSITVDGGGGTVEFDIPRSDRKTGPARTLVFDGPGSKEVSETWRLGEPGSRYSGWAAVHVHNPNDLTSEKASFSVVCDPDAAQPPQVKSSVAAPAYQPPRGTRVVRWMTRLSRMTVGDLWPVPWKKLGVLWGTRGSLVG